MDSSGNHHQIRVLRFLKMQSMLLPPPPPLETRECCIYHGIQTLYMPMVVAVTLLVTFILFLIITFIRKCINWSLYRSDGILTNQPAADLRELSLIIYSAPTSPSRAESTSFSMYGHRTCSICLADYNNGDRVTILLKCKHIFHSDCIKEWIPSRSVHCPVCRDSMMDSKASSPTSSTRSPSPVNVHPPPRANFLPAVALGIGMALN